jgi:glycosyltransferase involved in cell wall biosynthesis
LSHPDADSEHAAIAERAARAGVRRVQVLAFRDLDDPDAGGSEVHAHQLCTNLAIAGLDVVHHTGRVRGAPQETQRDGARVVRRGGRVGVFARTVVDVRSGRLGPCDGIIEIFHGIPFFAPIWARHTPQIGVVHHVHLGTWQHLLPTPGAQIGQLVEAHLVPRVYRGRRLVTVAASTRDEMVRQYGVSPDDVRVVENGVHERFSPGGTRSPAPLIVAVTRLVPQKGVDDVLEAMALVRQRLPAVRLAIVGDGPERGRLRQRIRELTLEDVVELVGYQSADAVVDWYRRAWVTVTASHREGFGLTITEAAACGTPAVARRIPGHSDAVIDGVTGLLADGVEGIADALLRVLEDDELRARLGGAAVERARTLRWDASARGIFDALCDVVERRR